LTARVRIVVYAALLALVAEESWSAIVHLSHSDFIVFWEAARRLSAHVDPFNAVAASAAAWHQLGVAHPAYSLPYAYLPELAWLLAPLGRLPFATADAIWLGVCLAGLIAALGVLVTVARRQPSRPRESTLLICAATITLASASGIAEGQLDVIVLLLTALGLALLPAHQFSAGVLLGVAAVNKPQIFWLVPVALLMVREWRTFLGMVTGALGACALGFLLVPPAQMAEWLRQLFQGYPAPSSTVAFPGIATDWGGPAAALLTAIPLAMVALAGVWWVRARLDARTALGLGIVLSLVVAPHDYSHDLLLIGAVAAVAGLIAGWPRVLALAIIAIDVTAFGDMWLQPPWDHLEALAVAALGIGLIWQARPTMEPVPVSTLEGAGTP
jgi:multidrug transporter EmrE-like cation transporter